MREGNYTFLLVGLMLLLLAVPAVAEIAPDVTAGPLVIGFAFTAVMLVGVWSLAASRTWYRAGLGLAAVSIVVSIMDTVTRLPAVILLQAAIALLFCIISMGLLMRAVLFGGRVNANRLVGAACIYLLIGVIWGITYIFLEVLSPGAFRGLGLDLEQPFSELDFLYYSFVTLTTLGYGDIAPLNSVARALAYLEAVVAVLYIAVMVATLVGAHMAEPEREQPPAGSGGAAGSAFTRRLRGNYIFLLLSMMVILFGAPLFNHLLQATGSELSQDVGGLLTLGAFCLALLIGAWSLTHSRLWFRVSWILVGLALAFAVLEVTIPGRGLKFITALMLLLFCVLSTILVMEDVLFGGRVDFNRLTGAACGYLLLGVTWALLYDFLDLLSPGSFSGVAGSLEESAFLDFLYFSFVTQSTLGYGDLTPLGPLARALAHLQAVVGQLYVGFLIATLVGAHLAARQKTGKTGSEQKYSTELHEN